MSDNSAWWVLLPVLCVGATIITVVLTITFVVRRVIRGTTPRTFNNTGGFRRPGASGSSSDTNPFGPGWTPDGLGGHSGGGEHPSHGGHVHGWGHGIDQGHHQGHHHGHDSGSSWSSSSDSGWSSSSDSGSSSSSDSGSSSSSDSGSSSSSSSD